MPNPAAAVLAAALSLAACASAPEPVRTLDCTLVLLKTGTGRGMSAEERQRVFAGHFANMSRLAKDGSLLLAGPFGAEKHDPSLRGIFVLDTADRARAQALAETDPGFQASVFALDYHALSTAAPLRTFLAAELAAQAEAERQGRRPQPGEGGRGYALLIAERADVAEPVLAAHPAVLLLGRLDGTRAFAVLDAENAAAARTALGVAAAQIGAYTVDDWFASGRLAELRAMGW
jgi:uncharacterized protein YciI